VLKFREADRLLPGNTETTDGTRSFVATSLPRSDEIERKVGDTMNSEDQNNDNACTFTELRLGSVMSQREVQILTTLFPKAAQTLADVLSNR
jgi:hypothetical protein